MKRLILILAVCAATAYPATVKGRVYDQSGAVTPGATIQLVNLADSSQIYKTVSAADGTYELLSVTAGKYELQAFGRGFAYWRRPSIVLQSNTEVALNVILRVGAIQDEVTVSGQGQPRPVDGPKPIRVGGNVQHTKLVDLVRPSYPAKAKAEGREGTVTFVAVIGKDGTINELVHMDGADPDLLEAAREAVMQWRYQPTLLNGAPVEVISTIDINFRLAQ
jgi:TonB family protein